MARGVTMIVRFPTAPPSRAVAVMVTVVALVTWPALMRPRESTLNTDGLELDQITFLSVVSLGSTCAESFAVLPAGSVSAPLTVTVLLIAAIFRITRAETRLPSSVTAVMVTLPRFLIATLPPVTVARPRLELVHFTLWLAPAGSTSAVSLSAFTAFTSTYSVLPFTISPSR